MRVPGRQGPGAGQDEGPKPGPGLATGPGPGRGAGSRAAALFAVLAALLGSVAAAAEAGGPAWNLGGSIGQRTFAAAAGTGPGGAIELAFGSATTMEAGLRVRGPVLRAEFSIEAAILHAAAAREFASRVAVLPPDTLYAPHRWADPGEVGTMLAARIRTAYVKWTPEGFSLTLGRQIVNYGKGIAWSPVDLFTPRDYSGLSVARRGGDAVRLAVPLGSLALAEAVAAPATNPGEGVYALRAAGLVTGTLDASLVGAWNGSAGAWICGGDFKFDIARASIHGDAAYSIPRTGGAGYLRAVLGFDTSFGDFVLAGEYYHDGAGPADPLSPGIHNAYAALSWKVADFHRLAASALANLDSGRFTSTLGWTWDLAQNGDLTTYLTLASPGTGAGTRAGSLGMLWEVKF